MSSSTRKPLVSVITPFLNAEEFLHEAIQSVFEQTYDNWELILVDDGSTDRGTRIAKEFASNFPDKVFYIEHENHTNKGASASRNIGFHRSRGEFISFLDADDIYLKHKLQDQIDILQKYPNVGMMYSATEYWYSWNVTAQVLKSDWIWNEFGYPPEKAYEPPYLLQRYLENGGTVPCMGSILARREAIQAMGGWEESFKYIYTDQVFHAKMAMKCSIYISSGCWDKYRQHEKSSCHVVEKKGESEAARFMYLLWLEKYLVEQQVKKDSTLWAAFQKAIAPYRSTHFTKLARVTTKFMKTVRGLRRRISS